MTNRWFIAGVITAASLLAIAVRPSGGQVVMYEFMSPSCAVCKSPAYLTTLDILRKEGVDLRSLDAGLYRDLFDRVKQPGTNCVPQFVVSVNGKAVSRAVGAQSLESLRAMWQRAGGNAIENVPAASPRAFVCRVLVDDGPSNDGGRITSGASGVLVIAGSSGVVLTNAHTVRDRQGAVTVEFANGLARQASILAVDTKLDLCALEVDAGDVPAAELADSPPPVGEQLVAAGNVHGNYQEYTGQVTGYAGASTANSPPEFLQVSCNRPVRQGDSGGPLIDGRGRLVGILFGQRGNLVHGAHCGRVREFIRRAIGRRRGGGVAPANLEPVPVKPSATYQTIPRPEAYEPSIRPSATRPTPPVVTLPAEPTSTASIGPAVSSDTCPVPPLTEQPADKSLGEIFGEAMGTWFSPAVKAALVYVGVPSTAAGALAYGGWTAFKFLRARRRRTVASGAGGAVSPPSSTPPAEAEVIERTFETPGRVFVRERHRTKVVEVPDMTSDHAWAEAHRIYIDHFPGSRHALKAVEKLHDQIMRGEPAEIGIK